MVWYLLFKYVRGKLRCYSKNFMNKLFIKLPFVFDRRERQSCSRPRSPCASTSPSTFRTWRSESKIFSTHARYRRGRRSGTNAERVENMMFDLKDKKFEQNFGDEIDEEQWVLADWINLGILNYKLSHTFSAKIEPDLKHNQEVVHKWRHDH